MKYKEIELENYPICDTDMWVNAVLADLDERLIEKYKKIVVADVVEREILYFGSHGTTQQIAQKFRDYKEEEKIIVIHHSDIKEQDRKLLERQLAECVYRFQTGLEDKPHERNKGEIVSAIYAEYFELPFLKSNDSTFHEGHPGRIAFPDLVVKNLEDMLKDLVPAEKERRERRQKVQKDRAAMNKEQRMYREEIKQKENMPVTQEGIDLLLQKLRGK